MNELQQILQAWRKDRQAGGVLATVVHVKGSAYRRPGARMWIGEDGVRIGSISGGCLEGDVARKAAWWCSGGRPALRVFDTTSDEEAVWEFGLGCNGVIYVLLEPVKSNGAQAMLEFLDECVNTRRHDIMATVTRTTTDSPFQTGDHFCGLGEMPPEMLDEARAALKARKSRILTIAGAEVFLEYVQPPQRLVVFGAGHDAMPLVSTAAMLGWQVTVADVRAGYTKPQRFPGAHSVQTLPPSGDCQIEIDEETAVVFITHNYPLDSKLLPQVLKRNPRYLGLLGPLKRTDRLLAEIGFNGSQAKMYAPVGLDLGGDGPEVIALSIISEVQAVLNGRTGMALRGRKSPIHAPVEEVGSAGLELVNPISEVAVCERG